MIAPKVFTDKLARFDPELKIRWGHRTKLWYIERPMPERHRQLLSEKPNPWKSARSLDLYEGWRLGRVHVLSVHPTLLDDRVVDTLAQADAWRAGGFDKISRQLDAEQEQWERQTDKQTDTFCEDASKEAYDRLAWLQGNRIATPFAEPAVSRLIETKKAGYKVRLRRVGDLLGPS